MLHYVEGSCLSSTRGGKPEESVLTTTLQVLNQCLQHAEALANQALLTGAPTIDACDIMLQNCCSGLMS